MQFQVLKVMISMWYKSFVSLCIWMIFTSQVMAMPFQQLTSELKPFSLEKPFENQEFKKYLNFYQLDISQIEHYAGYIQSKSFKIFTHFYQQQTQKSKGTILIVHGYFVHSGFLRYIVPELLKQGYQVLTIDLPGHGLSSGERVVIDHFSQYSQVLIDVFEKLKKELPQPLHIMGHSTGCSAIIDYLLTHKTYPFKKVILVAPLIRSFLWNLSRTGYMAAGNWVKELPRWAGNTSSDPEFLAFVKKDPLQYQKTPMKWFKALIEWNEFLKARKYRSNYHLTIIQGTDDTVVDWPYNLKFLKSMFSSTDIHIVNNARHDLFWEKKPIRKKVFKIIGNEIN